jgi:outer membrane receptor for ferrienterochelin and colicins
MKTLLTTLFFFLSLLAWSQFDSVRLQVLDAHTKMPVGGASIRGEAGQKVARGDGRFSLPLSTNAKWTISAIGYQSLQLKATAHDHERQVLLLPMENQLADVVVSGNLRPLTRMESPIPVEVYNQQFLKRNPTPNIFEALSVANGIQPQLNCNVCNTGDIHINGLEGPYTMILLDGMPIVSSLSTVYGLMGIPNSMIKRIEVVKGPASTLYGSEAVGGLINIITRDPLSAKKLAADIFLASTKEINTDLSYALSMGKATALIGVNGYHYWNKLDINNDNFTDVPLQKRLSLFTKWDWDRRNNLPAVLSARYFTETRWGGELNWNNGYKGSDSIYGEAIDTRRVELLGKYGLAKCLLFEASYNYHFQDSYYGTTWFEASQHTAFGQLRWNKKVNNHELMAGVPLRLILYDDNTPATAEGDKTNNPSKQMNLGMFVQDEWQMNDRLTLLSGLRYEYTNLQGSVMAPRVAVKYKLNSQHSLRLSGGNGFRIVNLFTEDHAAVSGSREVIVAETLQPEKSWNANVNYLGNFNLEKGIFTLDASLFFTHFSNKIIPDYTTDPNKIIYQNLDGYAISKGVTLNADYVNRKGVRANVGFTLMDVYAVENDIRERQQYAPVFSANFGTSIPISKWRTTIDITGKTTGPMRLPVVPNDFRPEYSPWFTIANLQITKRIVENIELYTAVKNLLNFIPKDPILHPDDPFDRAGGKYWNTDGTPNAVTNPNGYTFDPSYNYAPMQGAKVLVGCRFAIN